MNPFDVWDKSCELCGKGTAIFTIDKQLHGEYRRYHVCKKCKDQHERDLELCRSNFQAQFGEPEPKKNMDILDCFKKTANLENFHSDFIPGVNIILSDIKTTFDEKTMQMFCERCVEVGVDPDALMETGRLNMQLSKELEMAESCIPKWIKVEDALPETSDSVLVYTDRGHKYIGYYVNEYWCCDSQVSAFAYRMTDNWSGKVTHWIPLPDDPV